MNTKTCENCICHNVCSKRKDLDSTIGNFILSIRMNMNYIKEFKTGQFLLLAANCEYHVPYEEEIKNAEE